MPDFRITLKCGVDKWGWKETYFYTGADPRTSSGDANVIKAMVVARLALMATNCAVEQVVIAPYATNKGSIVYGKEMEAGPGTLKGEGQDPDNCIIPHMCLMWEALTANRATHSVRPLRGLPHSMNQTAFVAANVNSKFRAQLLAAWRNFVAKLGAGTASTPGGGPFGMVAREGGDDLRTPGYHISRVVLYGLTGLLAIEVPDASGIDVGSDVQIHMPRNCSFKGVSGMARVTKQGLPPLVPTSLPASSWWVLDKKPCCSTQNPQYNGKGAAYLVDWAADPSNTARPNAGSNRVVKPIAFANWIGVRKHDTGLQGLITRGRARGRTCCA